MTYIENLCVKLAYSNCEDFSIGQKEIFSLARPPELTVFSNQQNSVSLLTFYNSQRE